MMTVLVQINFVQSFNDIILNYKNKTIKYLIWYLKPAIIIIELITTV